MVSMATARRALRRRPESIMARAPAKWLELHCRAGGSPSHRRRVTILSRDAGAPAPAADLRRRGSWPAGSRQAAPRAPPRSPAPGRWSRRVRDGSSFENRSKIRSSRSSGTPGPRSDTASTNSSGRDSSSTVTSLAPACSRALSRRLARIRSSRRGSVSTTTECAGGTNRAVGCRAAMTARMRRTRSTGSSATSSAEASKRDSSMSSSTRSRSRRTSATSSSAARRLSGGSSSRCSPTIDASATRAATGVRSSCDTSATNRRFWFWAASSRRIVSARTPVIRLNRSAQVPNSSREVTGTRAARSPRSMRSAIRPASTTGARTPRTMSRTAASAMSSRTAAPRIRARRSWSIASCRPLTSWTK